MSSDTIEIRDIEFDASHVLEAINDAIADDDNEYIAGGAYQSGHIVVHGDLAGDMDGYVVDLDNSESVGLISLNDVRDDALDAITLPFEDYVQDLVNGFNDIDVATNTECGDATVDVVTNHIAQGSMRSLIEDDGCRVTYVSNGRVGVMDERDD
jgi:hypothetical protein